MGRSVKYSLVAGLIICIIFLFSIQISMAEENSVSTDIKSSYKVLPDEGIVKVTKEITVYNDDSDTSFWRGFYSYTNYYLPDDAMNIYAYDNEKQLNYTIAPQGYYVFNFNAKVWYEDSYTFYINYELEINKNTAYFSLQEFGDNIEVTLEIPSDFSTILSRNDYDVEDKMHSSIYRFENGLDWEQVCTVSSVRKAPLQTIKSTAHLSERDVDVEVNYWEGEDEWAEDVMDTTIQSLELLEEKWGIAYPAEYNISITEASMEETEGYGGFNDGRNGIYLLYTSNHGILIHELAHYWTRACNFDQLWMDEGYADLYTYIVLNEIDTREASSRRDRFLAKYEELKEEYDYPLAEWDIPKNVDETTVDKVDLGYKKAFSLTYTLYETVDINVLQAMNRQFMSSQSGIDNSEYIKIVTSTSNDMEFIENYIYA